jgi:enoyl-CoA hydratase/carnithine racemase
MAKVLTARSGSIAILRLNRPERLNAVDEELYGELLDGLERAAADPAVRAVILAGAGRAFCVGADLKAHSAGERSQDDLAEYVALGQQVCAQIQAMGTPVVAAVHGYALGAGAEIAVSADFLVMDASAQIGFPELSIGTFVGGAVTHRLPRLVGLRRATDLLFLGERLAGARAVDWGLAYAAVPDQAVFQPPGTRCLAAAQDLARQLADKAPISMEIMKASLRRNPSYEDALKAEADALLEVMKTADWAEGVAAFAERRSPVFTGR